MKTKNRDNVLIRKILNYCCQIETTHRFFNNNENFFFNIENGFTYINAISMPILQIGELTKNLSEEFCKTHNAIEWKQIARFRDILAHHYGSIDNKELWKTSHEDILELKNYLLKIITETSQEL